MNDSLFFALLFFSIGGIFGLFLGLFWGFRDGVRAGIRMLKQREQDEKSSWGID
jgi:hypothetical protein